MEGPLPPGRLNELRDLAERSSSRYLEDLEYLVNIDSGTYDRTGVDQVGSWMAERLTGLGGTFERHPGTELGDMVVATFEGAADGPSVLMVGHADTVFESGTTASRPFSADGHRAYGPGVSDMKSGLLLGLGAIALLRQSGYAGEDWLPLARLTFVIDPDEEIGSPASTPIITDLAQMADVALVLEGARPDGAIVSARAGMSHLRIDIEGVGAHAGVEPEKGRSAVVEAAHKTIALDALDRVDDGVSVNVGEIHGGMRPNIVAERATLTIDLRARRRGDQEAAEAAITAIAEAATVAGTTGTVELLARHWPMERTPAAGRLVGHAVALAAGLGFDLKETTARGASDANTTAAVGVPSLDGLGPVGGHPHAVSEYIELDTVVPRMALLAGLLLAVGRDPAFRG